MNLIEFFVSAISFVAAFAAFTGAILMYKVTQKFGAGILARGFKNIASGVLCISFGIIIDALMAYMQRYLIVSYSNIYFVIIFIIKGLCFVIGTYMIVIGSKKTVDKLESLTR